MIYNMFMLLFFRVQCNATSSVKWKSIEGQTKETQGDLRPCFKNVCKYVNNI